MMTQKLRIALIGLGDIAQKAWLPLVCQHPDITPIFCTRNRDTLTRLAAQYRVEETYLNIDELIAAQPDAVMIHSATSSHFALASATLKAKIPTFVDKPISDNIAEVMQLIELAKTQQTPLCSGFNRRFSPLLQPLTAQPLTHLRWQKNRHDLPGKVREFVFDDFIHVVDSLLHFSEPLTDIKPEINFVLKDKLLAALFLRIPTPNGLIEGSMNRISGQTFERVEAFADNQHWQIDNLRQGHHCYQGVNTPLQYSDWETTLYKRGFNDLLNSWLAQIRNGQPADSYLDRLLTTHQLCEKIVKYVETKMNL